jgi:hypothetical protein
MMNLKIYSKLQAPNTIKICNDEFLIPANGEFTISVRYWAELKLTKPKWIEGHYIYPENEADEKSLLNSYDSSFIKSISEQGTEQIAVSLTEGRNFTKYEIHLAKKWLTAQVQNKKDRSEKRDEDSLEISKRSERHAKRSNWIAGLALAVSIFTLLWTVLSSSSTP